MKNDATVIKLNLLYRAEEDGGYSVSVAELPGCFSEGETLEEAQSNIKEAIDLYMGDLNSSEVKELRSGSKVMISQIEISSDAQMDEGE